MLELWLDRAKVFCYGKIIKNILRKGWILNMSESKAKRFVTTSAVVLTMVSPLLSAATPVATVFAEDTAVSKNETTVDKLQAATAARDLAHKEYVSATVDFKSAESVLKSTTEAKDVAVKSLSDTEKVTADAEQIVADSTKAIVEAQQVVVEQTEVIVKAENRIENIKNVKELATQKLEEVKAEKAEADKKIENANKVIEAQKAIIETAKKAIETATVSKDEPNADIKQFKKLLIAAQEDLKNATDAVAKDKADGNVKTFETAIKQAQAKIDAADKIISDANKSISDANTEVVNQTKVVTDQTKVSEVQANVVSEQEKAIKDNNDLITEQNQKISEAKSKVSNAEQTIKTSTVAKTKAEDIISTNTSVITSAKDLVATTTNIADEAQNVHDSAKTRLEKAEKDLQVKQAAVDALRAESVKEQVDNGTLSTDSSTDSSGSVDTKTDTLSDALTEVKSARVEFVDASGTTVNTITFDLKTLGDLVKSAADRGISDVTVQSILDSEVAKYEGMVGSDSSVVSLSNGAYNVISVTKSFENNEYVIKVVVKSVGSTDDIKKDNTNTSSSSTDTSVSSSTDTSSSTSTSSSTNTSSSTSTSGSSTTTSSSSTNTSSQSVAKGQTSADGILTDILFNVTNDVAGISGKVNQSKLPTGTKLDGDYAKLIVTKADGTELATIDVASDYSFKGDFKEVPKDGDKLIIKYGGKIYEVTYTLDASKTVDQTNSSSFSQNNQTTSGTTTQSTTRQNAKSGLLPSTGQRNLLGMTVAGVSLIIVGIVAFVMKFRKKNAVNDTVE